MAIPTRVDDELEFLTRIQVFKMIIDKAKELCSCDNGTTGIPKNVLLGHVRLALHILDIDECYAHYAINVAVKMGCLVKDHGFLQLSESPDHLIALRLMIDGFNSRHIYMRQLAIKFDIARTPKLPR
jgi:hypothetical protein